MSEAFLGEIRMFAGSYAPKDWMFCNGAILPIARYSALFSLLGTAFGGNGVNTFQLPNLVDTVALGTGAAPGLTQRSLGETGGAAMVALTPAQMAPHSHAPSAFPGAGLEASPEGAVWATSTARDNQYATGTPDVEMAPVIGAAGGGLPHENRAPFLAVNYIICVNGIFPPRP
jgi:microcystin-dependent protein